MSCCAFLPVCSSSSLLLLLTPGSQLLVFHPSLHLPPAPSRYLRPSDLLRLRSLQSSVSNHKTLSKTSPSLALSFFNLVSLPPRHHSPSPPPQSPRRLQPQSADMKTTQLLVSAVAAAMGSAQLLTTVTLSDGVTTTVILPAIAPPPPTDAATDSSDLPVATPPPTASTTCETDGPVLTGLPTEGSAEAPSAGECHARPSPPFSAQSTAVVHSFHVPPTRARGNQSASS